jgi:hypothetical protein
MEREGFPGRSIGVFSPRGARRLGEWNARSRAPSTTLSSLTLIVAPRGHQKWGNRLKKIGFDNWHRRCFEVITGGLPLGVHAPRHLGHDINPVMRNCS